MRPHVIACCIDCHQFWAFDGCYQFTFSFMLKLSSLCWCVSLHIHAFDCNSIFFFWVICSYAIYITYFKFSFWFLFSYMDPVGPNKTSAWVLKKLKVVSKVIYNTSRSYKAKQIKVWPLCWEPEVFCLRNHCSCWYSFETWPTICLNYMYQSIYVTYDERFSSMSNYRDCSSSHIWFKVISISHSLKLMQDSSNLKQPLYSNLERIILVVILYWLRVIYICILRGINLVIWL